MDKAPTPEVPEKPPILPKGAKAWAWLAIKLLVSGGILFAALSKVDVAQVSAAFARISPPAYAASLLFASGGICVAAFRWSLLTWRLQARLRSGDAVGAYFGALFVGQVLPSTLGVDAVRGWLISRKYRPISEVIAGIMVDRSFGLVGLGVLMLLGAPRLLTLGDVRIGETATIAAAVLIGGAIAAVGGAVLFLRMRITGPVARLQDAIRLILKAVAHWEGALAMVLSVLVHAMIAYSIILIAAALDVPIPIDAGLATIPAAMLISTIPVSINGWGLREGAMIACLGLAGVPASTAFVVSILFGIGQFLIALPGIAYWVFARPGATR